MSKLNIFPFSFIAWNKKDAVNLAINADEPLEQNYIRKHFLEDMEKDGMEEESARYRIFGCPPGAYGKHFLFIVIGGDSRYNLT